MQDLFDPDRRADRAPHDAGGLGDDRGETGEPRGVNRRGFLDEAIYPDRSRHGPDCTRHVGQNWLVTEERSNHPAVFAAAVLVVASVLVFDPWGWAAFGPAKWAAVGVASLVLIAVTARRRIVPLHRPSAVGWVLFLGWGAVVAAAGLDPLHAWVGTPDRHLGFVAWVLFAGVFVAGQSIGAAAMPVVMRAGSVALGGAGAYVLLELADAAPVDLALASSRAGGTFGSAAYLGAACALLVPVAVGHALDRTERIAWRRGAALAAVLGLVTSLAAQTRAGWVGLAAAAVVAAPAVLPWLRRRVWALGAAALVAVMVVTLTPVGGRIAGAFDFDDGAAKGRIDEWQVGVTVFANHPVLGVGFEGYRLVFAEGVDADYEQRYGRAVMPDRVHNAALDVGVTTGVVGVALYLAAAVFLVGRGLRAVRERRPWLVGVAAGVVGYLVQQLFLFPLAEFDVVFWLFAGVLVAATSHVLPAVRVPSWVWTVPVALAAAALVAGVLDVAADRASDDALARSSEGLHHDAVDDARRAVSFRPDSIRYRVVEATVARASGTSGGLTEALDAIDAALELSPRDPILLAEHASILLERARANRDGADLAAALAEWEALIAGDPHHARYRFEAGIAYRIAGDVVEAEQSWRQAAALAPRSPAPWANLAALHLELGDAAAAAAAIAELRMVDPDDPALGTLDRRLAALRRSRDR